ncbi:hypothetical protein Egran_01689 [Elaphomyces granulatus]|uniref:Uncharacterized protein n=1 Tax=Elaphomyces granulatus TaxID=519963 RepID=A0A232M2B3_9EURO|nr:hypothetical protein Egran_01689 [Elaphomyces granulatus]
MHQPRLADFFEDFTRPHTSLYSNLAAAAAAAATAAAATAAHQQQQQQHQQHHHHQQQQQQQQQQHHHHHHQHHPHHASSVAITASAGTIVPSFLPVEEVYVLPQYQPVNPEDEDDVVPDQHAAFGIARAMDLRREPAWRDLGLPDLVSGGGPGTGVAAAGAGAGSGSGAAGPGTSLPPGGASGWRLKQSGALMGGRRTVCLR